jgi:hypothetical protein
MFTLKTVIPDLQILDLEHFRLNTYRTVLAMFNQVSAY